MKLFQEEAAKHLEVEGGYAHARTQTDRKTDKNSATFHFGLVTSQNLKKQNNNNKNFWTEKKCAFHFTINNQSILA